MISEIFSSFDNKIEELIQLELEMHEGMIARICHESLREDDQFIIGNSMPIRDVDMFTKRNEIKIRLDSGVHEGSEVSMYYDPMMAKLVTHGKNRENARKNLSTALDLFVLDGISTNISFLNNVLNNKIH